MTLLIQVKSVSKHYKAISETGRITVLQDVSFDLREGQSLCLLGENGAGKSTLARLLLGMEVPDSGQILFQGRMIGNKAHRHELKRFIQMIWQDPAVYLNPYYTAGELIIEPMKIFGPGDRFFHRNRMMQLLDAVGLSGDISTRRPCELSGGQCQRVAIARALAIESRVLICDEALASLDIPQQARILKLLLNLQQNMRLTCLFITHDPRAVSRLCPKMAVLKAGKIIETGDTCQLLHRSVDPYVRQLMQIGNAPSDEDWQS